MNFEELQVQIALGALSKNHEIATILDKTVAGTDAFRCLETSHQDELKQLLSIFEDFPQLKLPLPYKEDENVDLNGHYETVADKSDKNES